jgi:hypothetical protein
MGTDGLRAGPHAGIGRCRLPSVSWIAGARIPSCHQFGGHWTSAAKPQVWRCASAGKGRRGIRPNFPSRRGVDVNGIGASRAGDSQSSVLALGPPAFSPVSSGPVPEPDETARWVSFQFAASSGYGANLGTAANALGTCYRPISGVRTV